MTTMPGGVTADLAAHAVLAAVISLGEEPAAWLDGPPTGRRRALLAAASGLNVAGLMSVRRAAVMLGVNEGSVCKLRARGDAGWDRAEALAADAAAWALRVGIETPRRAPAPAGIVVPEAVTAESPLRERLLFALADGACSSMGLATLAGAKELDVCRALSALEHEGVVEAGPMPEEGRRHQRWRLRGRADA
ncbi:hypothetical protein [Phenylobacterium sp.]|uniref:hypothetical protein n=1 Tax=Phenylobacterium sp. TaxID=1871053 RepID=UPI0025E92ABD|nr:hypothetical protein [Phenylobacterium sp.]MBX3482515.1 hypothetical protein [Phenylobacterium sp.]MCW5758262.1 hypothetical protein [Phenylobacterium sp.]